MFRRDKKSKSIIKTINTQKAMSINQNYEKQEAKRIKISVCTQILTVLYEIANVSENQLEYDIVHELICFYTQLNKEIRQGEQEQKMVYDICLN